MAQVVQQLHGCKAVHFQSGGTAGHFLELHKPPCRSPSSSKKRRQLDSKRIFHTNCGPLGRLSFTGSLSA
eukprot:6976592-Pyramimonas_sp.AAC.1